MQAVTRTVALVAIVSVSVMGLAGVASAKAAKGSPAWCKAHPHSTLSACQGSSSGGGSGGPSPTITVTVAPNPLVETGLSEIRAVVEVETSPSLSGATVHIDSSQLAAVCGGAVLFGSLQPGAVYGADSVQVVLDADGNATVNLYGIDCAPGPSVVEADLVAAPYYTALTILNVLPPNVTPAGVTGYPDQRGGDGQHGGERRLRRLRRVLRGDRPRLRRADGGDRIGAAVQPLPRGHQTRLDLEPGAFATSTATATLDDDGNAVFSFTGSSCAAGTSTVIADVLAGIHSTYVTTYTILAPAPTI